MTQLQWSLSELTAINNGVNQEDIPAPTLLSIFLRGFSRVLCWVAKSVITCASGPPVESLTRLVSMLNQMLVKLFENCLYRKGHANHNGPSFENMRCIRANPRPKKTKLMCTALRGNAMPNITSFFIVRGSGLLIALTILEVLSLYVVLCIQYSKSKKQENSLN